MYMLFREIVYHTNTHFLPIRGREFLNGTTVKFRTKALFRIQTNAALLFFHEITPIQDVQFPGHYKREILIHDMLPEYFGSVSSFCILEKEAS